MGKGASLRLYGSFFVPAFVREGVTWRQIHLIRPQGMIPPSLKQMEMMMKKHIQVILTGLILLSQHAFSAEALPAGTGFGGLYYSDFSYRTAWDGERNRLAIGTREIAEVNAMLGADLVGGRYRADYQYFTLDLLAGLSDQTTVRLQIPYFRSEVRQRVDVFAPPPAEGMIRAQLEALDFRTETLRGNGWGDLHLWLYHRYFSAQESLELIAGAGWRSPVTATRFGRNTEKLNVATREAETLLLTHQLRYPFSDVLSFQYRLEYQHPFEGDQDVFVPGTGVVNVPYTPGWWLTHQADLTLRFFDERMTASAGIWYRDEGSDTTMGVRSGSRDALWYTGAVGYNGMKDFEEERLVLPVFAEVRYWYLQEARNFQAYYDSYWEFWVGLPLWSR